MLIRMTDWEHVREHFSQEEKDRLNKAYTGETICPRGISVDEDKVPDLIAKLRKLLSGAQRTPAHPSHGTMQD